jgi:hypothetical protein
MEWNWNKNCNIILDEVSLFILDFYLDEFKSEIRIKKVQGKGKGIYK